MDAPGVYGEDEHYRKFTAIPFGFGLFFILSYYLVILPREKMREKKMAASIDTSEPGVEMVGIN